MKALLLSALMLASAHADAGPRRKTPSPPRLVMSDASSGAVTYPDPCGANSGEAPRKSYISNLLTNKASKLALVLAKLEADNENTRAFVGSWEQTYNERIGCSDLRSSYSAFVLLASTYGTGHELSVKYIVTIDDDVSEGKRTLSIRSIEPVTIRQE